VHIGCVSSELRRDRLGIQLGIDLILHPQKRCNKVQILALISDAAYSSKPRLWHTEHHRVAHELRPAAWS